MAAASWPHFVPRAELDAELRELRGRLEQVVRSVAGLEGRAALAEDALGDLRARCRDELATRLALGGVESRLEVDVGICRQELEEGLLELRGSLGGQASALRTEAAAAAAELREGLALAGGERERLGAATDALRAHGEQSFATREDHAQASSELRGELEAVRATLSGDLEAQKEATRAEVAELERALAAAAAAARQDVEQVERGGQDGLHELDQRVRENFSTLAMLQELRHDLNAVAQHSVAQQAAELQALADDLTRERSALSEIRGEQGSLSLKVSAAARSLGEMGVAVDGWRAQSDSRHEKQEQQLAHMSQFQELLLAQWKRRAEAQEQAHEEACSSQEELRRALESHAEAQRAEGERLREHSTLRLVEQLDHAMQLQRSVDKIAQEHERLAGLAEGAGPGSPSP